MKKIEDLLSSIQTEFEKGEFDKFIHEMNFPKFKSFAPKATIQLKFPVTILVGPNGGGKSSLLHAAWGMPRGYSTSRFWFSTAIDPIDFASGRNRYWYTHYIKALKLKVETRKIFGRKRHGYWEPTRPAQNEGMQPMPAKNDSTASFMSDTGDRWSPVERIPHYFNARAESSAFDRFFNSSEIETLGKRQDYFVKYAKKLKEVVDGNLLSLEYYNVERVSKNFFITAAQLSVVNFILQKNYVSAQYVSHKFYDKSFSPSVIFCTKNRTYSESFAGSGELAVVNYILSLEKIKKYDLLLLDEPETSLHPGAQAKLLQHLLSIVEEKYIQVIVSTHSETFVRLLPNSSLVVLEESPDGVKPRSDPSKSSAFSRLGTIDKNKVTIITEDKLLKAVADRAVAMMPKHLIDRIDVIAADVGSSEMLSNQVKAYIQSNANVLMILDGDQTDVKEIFDADFDDLSSKQQAKIREDLKSLHVSIVGSKDELKAWMKWCSSHVILTDDVCPEQVLLRLLAPTHALLKKQSATNKEFKSAVRQVLHKSHNETTPEALYFSLKLKLGEDNAGTGPDSSISSLSTKIQEYMMQFE